MIRTAKIIVFLLLGLLAAWWCYFSGARINRSISLPVGLYWKSSKHYEKGDTVMFRPSDSNVFNEAHQRGYIAGSKTKGFGLLFKIVVAIEGDVVSINDQGVSVNNALLPNSVPFEFDNMGNPLPRLRLENYVIGAGEVLLLANHIPESFDGRYFGPQPAEQIEYVVTPILVF